jgi:hypothetical protein
MRKDARKDARKRKNTTRDNSATWSQKRMTSKATTLYIK